MKKLMIVAAVTATIAGASGSVVAHAEGIHKVNSRNRNEMRQRKNTYSKKKVKLEERRVYSASEITKLSAIFESNGNPGSISSGLGDFGGKSYGAWQFSSNTGTLSEFISYLKRENYDFYFVLVRSEFKDKNHEIRYGEAFDKTWKRIASKYPNTFYNLQMDFVKVNYYDKLARKLMRHGGFAKALSNLAVQNVLVSTAVQNGVTGAYNMIIPFAYTDSPKVLIEKIYNKRAFTNSAGVLVGFRGSSKNIQQGVKNRLVVEEATALKML